MHPPALSIEERRKQITKAKKSLAKEVCTAIIHAYYPLHHTLLILSHFKYLKYHCKILYINSIQGLPEFETLGVFSKP